jgi:hypothetical protein
MNETNYPEILQNAFKKLEGLHHQREALNVEIFKMEQFISATASLVPDEMRVAAKERLAIIQELFRIREVGLTDAIRSILKKFAGQSFTVADIRDRLCSFGFDFTGYASNPLASVSTTLRRMKPEEVETIYTDDGPVAYRWKDTEKADVAAHIAAVSSLGDPPTREQMNNAKIEAMRQSKKGWK